MKASLSELSSASPSIALLRRLLPGVVCDAESPLSLFPLRTSRFTVVSLARASPPDCLAPCPPPLLFLLLSRAGAGATVGGGVLAAAAGAELDCSGGDACGTCVRMACERCTMGGAGTRIFRRPLHSFATEVPPAPSCTRRRSAGYLFGCEGMLCRTMCSVVLTEKKVKDAIPLVVTRLLGSIHNTVQQLP